MIQTEKFEIEVEAENKESAETMAIIQFNQGNYRETGNINVSVGDIREV